MRCNRAYAPWLRNETIMRTAKVISLSLPPEMEVEMQQVAKEEMNYLKALGAG
ncbi:MAG: hypothetical protein JWQ35_859 [Bacteriovoracaceae bacterium]|nr:hypothetical protein [Bacteriovoracaceae bacterium]